MNLLIAEDEIRLRTNIATHIPWEEHGIEVIAVAENGKEAIRLFEQTRPDIAMLDIQMPEADGLTVARYIAGRQPQTKLIILSGHDDFRYAQEAIELGVVKYLLKPAGEEELLEVVLEARDRLREERAQYYNQAELQSRWEEHLPRLRELFYQSLVSSKYDSLEISRKSRELGIELAEAKGFAVVAVDPDPLPDMGTSFTAKDTALLQFTLKKLAEEYHSQDDGCIVFPDLEGRTVLLYENLEDMDPDVFMAEVQQHASRLLGCVKEILKVTASAGIGMPVTEAENISRSYEQACRALRGRVLYGHDIVIPFRDDPGPSNSIPQDAMLEKRFMHALEAGNAELANQAIDELVVRGIGTAGSVDEAFEHVLYFSSLLVRTVQGQGWPVSEALGEYADSLRQPEKLATREHIVRWLHGAVNRIAEHVNRRNAMHCHDAVKGMLAFVDANLDQDISLQSVADKLYINSSYLSRLFKQQVGQAFSDYVLERKMKLSMKGLADGMKVVDAAKLSGYRDVSYFIKVFRKYWGITPGEVK
ncbi:response regulator [Paenibacillus sp. MBLB4367]|uniref:response regulator transcription factor n=1 Tax=Paenibacillus sp. MBLB4367 TaxID=3384767 RepID=UPI003908432F